MFKQNGSLYCNNIAAMFGQMHKPPYSPISPDLYLTVTKKKTPQYSTVIIFLMCQWVNLI